MSIEKFYKPIFDIENDPVIKKIRNLTDIEFMALLSKDKTRYQINNELLLREVAGEYLLIPTGNASSLVNGMISLNDTFYYVWKQFEEPHTIYDVVLTAKKEYQDTNGRIAKDIYNFVIESLKLNFIKEVKQQ